MRMIAEKLKDEIDANRAGMNYNYIMAQANHEAQQAVDEFKGALEAVRTVLAQQQGWLADENHRLEELRRA